MFNKLKELVKRVAKLSNSLEKYEKDSVIQAMPSLAYVNRAKKCIEKENYSEAEKILEEAMELPYEDALVYKYLGIVCEKTNRLADSVIAYKKSAKIDNHDKEIWRLLGFALINTNLCSEAVEAFENANKITPKNTDVFAGWGMALMKLKKYEEAHEKFMESVRINKYNFMALLLAAMMEVRTKKYTDAEAKLSFLTNVSPNETNYYEYANLKYIKGDYSNAILYAKRALEFNQKLLPIYLLLGKLYAIKGLKKDSLNTYQQAFDNGLITPNLFYDWAVTLQMYYEYEEAKINFTKAHDYAPEEDEITAGLALISACLNDNKEAESYLSKIKEINPSNYLYVKAKALINYNNGRYEEAICAFKSLQAEMFFDNTLNFYIASSYNHLNDTKNAREYYDKTLLNGTDCIKVYLEYSDFLIRTGECASAQRKLNRALKLNEKNLEILNRLFEVNYILVKENNSEYNMREVLAVAQKIKTITGGEFKYAKELEDLENTVKDR